MSSCCKVNYIDPPAIDNPSIDSIPYKLIWETPLFSDTSGSYNPHFPPVIIGNSVIYASNHLRDEYIDSIKAYDLKTGEIKWVWSDFKTDVKATSKIVHNNKNIYVTNGIEVVGIDAQTGQTILRRISYQGKKQISTFNDIIFHGDRHPKGLYSKLMMFDIKTNSWVEVFKTTTFDNFIVRLFPPQTEVNQDNDTILYFQNRLYQESTFIESSELYCYNLTKDSIIWKVSPVDSFVSNLSNPPLIDESNLYFLTAKTFHCYNKYTGKVIWETHFPNTNFLVTNYLLADDKVVICADNGDLIGVNKNTGSVLYDDFKYTSSLHSIIYKNYILNSYKSGLDIFDINNGELLHRWDPHRSPGQFNTGAAVDENTGYIYISDGFYLECIEFPEK